MAITLVQNEYGSWAGGSSLAVTLTSTTAGNTLIVTVGVGSNSTSPTVSTIATTGGTAYTWVKDVARANGKVDVEVWRGTGGSGATSLTMTLTGSAGNQLMVSVLEWQGNLSVDQTGVTTGWAVTFNGPSLTPTYADELFMGAACSYDDLQITSYNGYTNAEPGTSGELCVNYLVATDSAAHYPTFNDDSGTANAYAAVASSYYIATSAPSAPTLTAPSNASYQDVASGETFSATYNSTDTLSQNAYAMRIKVSGAGSYQYFNAGTNSLQSTIVWNTDSVAIGGSWSVTLPAGILTDGNVYNWSMASQESGANKQGAFASDFTFSAQAPPSVSVTAPSGTITGTTSPAIVWSDTLPSGATQTNYSVIVESGVYGTTPGSGTSVWASGVVSSASTSVNVGVSLTPGVTYRAFVQVTESGGQTSQWAYTTFTIQADVPAVPLFTAVPGFDPTTGSPLVTLTLQGQDNQLTLNQASLESNVTTGWAAGSNTTIATSSVWAQDGSYSLALTATAAGAVSASTPTGTSGVACSPGQVVRAMGFFHSPATARACTVAISFFNASGALILTSTSTSVNSTLTGNGGQAFITGTAPALTASMSLTINGAGLSASELLYADCMFLGPSPSLATPYDALVASLNPSAWWKLADAVGSTTALDSSGNGHTGTVTGGVTFGEPGAISGTPSDTAALFDGSTGEVYSSGTVTGVANAGSLAAWFKISGSPGGGTIALAGIGAYTTDGGIQIAMSGSGVLSLGAGVNLPTNNTTVAYNDAKWHLAVVTIDSSGNVKGYVDGAQEVSFTATTNSAVVGLNIGAWFGGYFPGDIAEVSIFPTALTASQVSALYNAAPVDNGTWTAGGFVGGTVANLTFSDDGVNWFAVRNGTGLAIPTTSQTVSVADYEGSLGFTRHYQAQVVY